MNCPNGKQGCHRMRTILENVVKKFPDGDAEILTKQFCRECGQTRSFTTVQQSLFTQGSKSNVQ